MKILFLTCLAMILNLPQDSGSYSIHGVTSDASGNRAANVSVQLLKLDGAPDLGRHETVSMQDGSYEIGGLSAGKYRLFVSKPTQGIPDSRFLIFEQIGQKYDEVSLGPKVTNPRVDLKLPLSYGQVDGRVIDAGNGGQALRGRIHLERGDANEITYETDTDENGHFTLLLPNRPLSFSVTLPGYEKWVFHDDQGKNFISLQQGTTITLVVLMKKAGQSGKR